MHIKKLTLQNYKSVGRTPLEFSFEEGLNLIKGSPGEGKTLIFSAIVYGLFSKNSDFKGGKSTLPATKLVNDINKKEMLVTIELSNGYTIERGMKPNIFNITKNGKNVANASTKTIDDDYLVKHCLEGLTLAEFYKTVYLSDKAVSSPFLYMSNSERKLYIENLLNLRRIPILLEHLKTEVSMNKMESQNVEANITATINAIESEKVNLEKQEAKKQEIDQAIEDFEHLKETRLKEINQDISSSMEQIIVSKNEIEKEHLEIINKAVKSKEDIKVESKNKANKFKDTHAKDLAEAEAEAEQSYSDETVKVKEDYEEKKQSIKNKLGINIDSIKERAKSNKSTTEEMKEITSTTLEELKGRRENIKKELELLANSIVIVDNHKLLALEKRKTETKNRLDEITIEVKERKSKLQIYNDSQIITHNCTKCGNVDEIRPGITFDIKEHGESMATLKAEYMNLKAIKKNIDEELEIIDNAIIHNANIDNQSNKLKDEFDLDGKLIGRAEEDINKYITQLGSLDESTEKEIEDAKNNNIQELDLADKDLISAMILREENHSKDLDTIKYNYEDKFESGKTKIQQSYKDSIRDIENQILRADTDRDNRTQKEVTDVENRIKNQESMKESILAEKPPIAIDVSYEYLETLKAKAIKLDSDKDKVYNEGVSLKTMKDVINDKEHKKKALESYLPVFENKLNSLLDRFLEDMEFTLKAEIKEDFDIEFKKNGKPVSVFELSSGQKSLVNISTTFAFLHLLQLKHKTRFNHLLIDEILDISLGDQVGKVFEYLKEVSSEKNVTVISHNNQIPSELIDRTLHVEKKGPFSTYKTEKGLYDEL